ncbi:hypothetical protein HYS54_03550 [Candidatus Micrarchaeota archaeon]|nr:hypothetical protein [Candidatus Micrarchaeota archaeon]
MLGGKTTLLLLVTILLAFYLKQTVIGGLLLVFLVVLMFASPREPARAAVPKSIGPASVPETIYPVVYEDVGDRPYLWNPKTTVLLPKYPEDNIDRVVGALGKGTRAVTGLFSRLVE